MEKETVICSAIWFNDGREHPHQPKNITSGFVVCGRRHHNCYSTLHSVLSFIKFGHFGENDPDKKEILKWFNYLEERDVQGFLTSQNRFLNRKEAYDLVVETGQCEKEKIICKNKLTSEDLY